MHSLVSMARCRMQAIEALAQRVADEVRAPHSAAAALGAMQLDVEAAFRRERTAAGAEARERRERVDAKLNHILAARRANPTVQEMRRLYDQARAPRTAVLVRMVRGQVALVVAGSLRCPDAICSAGKHCKRQRPRTDCM
jgi:hypothetical protein